MSLTARIIQLDYDCMPRTVTLPKTEYERLRRTAERYEMVQRFFEAEFFAPPSTRDVRQIIRDFRKTSLYTEPFLKSLERGLRESSYFSRARRRS